MINIYGNYYMDADSNEYIVYFCGKREKMKLGSKIPTGEIKEYKDLVGYYRTLTAAIKGCITHALRNKVSKDEISTLSDCLDFISNAEEKILDATKGL